MNREIKFRAWHKEKKIMVYDNEDDTYGYWDGCRNSNVGMINTILNSKYYKDYEFMQYTGLHDKNGKEIFEGDIVKLDSNMLKMTGIVTYYDDEAMFVLEDFSDEIEECLLYMQEDLEVIGNIYDNFKLLRGE